MPVTLDEILALGLWLAAVNTGAVAAFAFDKARARSGGRRIPERVLLGLAAAGGTPGSYWARARFRHKTVKQPFSALLHAITAAQAAAVAAGLYLLV